MAEVKSLEKRPPFFSISVFSRMCVYVLEVLLYGAIRSYFANLL